MEEQEINIEGEQAANMEEEEYREQEANMEEEEYREQEDMEDQQHVIDKECIVHISDESTLEVQLKTKLCSAILKALGTNVLEELVVFDDLRHKLKQKIIQLTEQCRSRHTQLVDMYRERLLIEERRLQASIKEFEIAFYYAHNCLPDVNKVEDYSRLTKSK